MARKKRDKHEKRMKSSNRRSRDSSIDNNDGRSSGFHDTDSIAESSFSIYSAFGTAAAGSMISSEDGDDQTLTINKNDGSKTTSKNNNNNNNLSATTCATIVDYDDFAHRLDSLLGQMRETKISPKMRCENFNALSRTMITRMCDEYLDRRELTLQDILERAFRRASPAEMESAASTLTISLITLASGGGGGKLFASLYAILQRTLLDPTAHPRARAKCAITLAIGCFIIDDDDDDGDDHGDEQKRHNLSAKLLKIAFESRANCDDDDDDGGGDNEHEQFALRECCLTMFALLASIENRAFARKCLSASGAGLRFYDCLESSNFSVRIAAGKCVAMLLEIEFDDDGDGDEDEDEDSVEEEEEADNEDYEDDADDDYDDDEFRNHNNNPHHNHHNLREMLLERLQCLATDSQRWRSKKDLRQQRSIFRAILRATRGEDYESQTVRIGASGCNDSIIIDCWRTSVRYDAFRSVLGSGISLHLARNRCLREIFDLGPPVSAAIALEIDPNRKSSIVTDRRAAKLEKASLNHFNRKNRELNRAKVRSKRSDYHPNGSGGRRSSSSSD